LGIIDDSAGDLLQINSNMKALKCLRWCWNCWKLFWR